MSNVLKATVENKTTSVTTHLKKLTTENNVFIVSVIMVALWNRADHYIFALWFLHSFFFLFSSPNLSGRRLDVCHTSRHVVALVRIFRMQV